MSTATPRSSRDASVSEVPRTDHLDAARPTDLHKFFGNVATVNGVDLTVSPGEVVALLDPNGAGETTTVDTIPRLSRPIGGDARAFGMSPRQAVDRDLVITVMQTVGLLSDVTVREMVQLTVSLFSHRIGAEDAVRRAGVTDFVLRIAKKYLGGQQQRLHFAMMLVSGPALLILDESTTGTDVEGRRSFWGVIHAGVERGRITVFATHYLEEADVFADRIVLMRHGCIIANGTAAEIRASVNSRSLRVTLVCAPGRLRDTLTGSQIRGQVYDVEILGSSPTLSLTDTDAMAALLLNECLIQGLEITSQSLEDTFVALTSDSASTFSVRASA